MGRKIIVQWNDNNRKRRCSGQRKEGTKRCRRPAVYRQLPDPDYGEKNYTYYCEHCYFEKFGHLPETSFEHNPGMAALERDYVQMVEGWTND